MKNRIRIEEIIMAIIFIAATASACGIWNLRWEGRFTGDCNERLG